jgi:hypothetical protein
LQVRTRCLQGIQFCFSVEILRFSLEMSSFSIISISFALISRLISPLSMSMQYRLHALLRSAMKNIFRLVSNQPSSVK